MKTKNLLVSLTLLLVCVNISAQRPVKAAYKNLYVGCSPTGSQKITFKSSEDNIDYTYRYKSYFDVTVAKEGRFRRTSLAHLIEFSYSNAKLDEIKLNNVKGKTELSDVESVTLHSASAGAYVGSVINNGRRVQVPLFLGVGLSYINGSPFHHLTPFFGLKGRLDIFITDRIGIWGGGSYRIGLGNSGTFGTFVPSASSLECGLMFALN